MADEINRKDPNNIRHTILEYENKKLGIDDTPFLFTFSSLIFM